MCHKEPFVFCFGFRDQIERVDRLLTIINSTNPYPHIGNVEFDDLLQLAIQSMWHVKDWILNDPSLTEEEKNSVSNNIHSRRCLLICSDLANGIKHMRLRNNKTGFSFIGQTGVHLDGKKGICMRYYEIYADDPTDPYHLMEIRDLLAECRAAWGEIGEILNKMAFDEFLKAHLAKESGEWIREGGDGVSAII
jgi:hypothetical protein